MSPKGLLVIIMRCFPQKAKKEISRINPDGTKNCNGKRAGSQEEQC